MSKSPAKKASNKTAKIGPSVVQPIRIYRQAFEVLAAKAEERDMPVATYLRRILEDHAEKMEKR